MKKYAVTILLLIFAVVSGLNAKSTQIINFNELMASLKTGEKVRLVIHYGNCKLYENFIESKSPDAIGGMEITNFEYFAPNSVKNDKGFLVVSESQLISHPRYGFVLNYIKIRIDDDGKVKITAQCINPKNYEVKMDETFQTEISKKAAENGGFFIYKD